MPRRLGDAPNPNADPQAKDKFKNLDSDFKDAVAAESEDALRKRITDLCSQAEALDQAKKDDEDLISKKETYDTAVAPYKEQQKDIKLRIKFILRVLSDQGKV